MAIAILGKAIMKKALIETSIFIGCGIIGVSFIYFGSTKESKELWQHYDTITLIKANFKQVLILAFALWIISAFLRALISMFRKRKP